MTTEQLRSNSQSVVRMREIISDPVFASAIVAVRDKGRISDVAPQSDAVSSVRQLSRIAGYNEALDELLLLSEPMPVELPDEAPTWGQSPEVAQPVE